MVDRPPVPPGAAQCWQVMTGLSITTRAEAIEYLRLAAPWWRLSAGEIRGLLCAFPVLPPRPARAGREYVAATGPDVLAYAAQLLPSVLEPGSGVVDVQQVLFEALRRLRVGAGRGTGCD